MPLPLTCCRREVPTDLAGASDVREKICERIYRAASATALVLLPASNTSSITRIERAKVRANEVAKIAVAISQKQQRPPVIAGWSRYNGSPWDGERPEQCNKAVSNSKSEQKS